MDKIKNLKNGFTLAEVLITLVVLGIIAAISLPTLFHNLGDKQYKVPLKKIYAVLNEAFDLTVNFSDDFAGDIDIKSNSDMRDFYVKLKENLAISKFCCSDASITTGNRHENANCFNAIARDGRCFVEAPYVMNYTTSDSGVSNYPFILTNWGTTNIGASFILKDGASVALFPAVKGCDSSKVNATNCWGIDRNMHDMHTTPIGVVVDVNGPDGKPNMKNQDMFAFLYTKSDGLLPAGNDRTTVPSANMWVYTATFLNSED